MASEHLWIPPGGPETDISGRVQLPKPGEDGFRLHSQAVEGSVGSSDILLDDEAGGFYVTGLNAYRVRETLSEADDPYVFAGGFGRRKESRGPYKTGPSRQIFAQVQDVNAGLSKYVIREGEDGDRPEETDTERWEWLRGTGVFPAESDYDDSLFIIDPAGVTLSAANLQDYTAQQIIDDMAQQSGRNYYVYFDGVTEKYFVVYALDSGDHLTSDLRFSNVETDADGATTFYAGQDWELDISPERVASTVIVRYANGSTGETDDDTAAEFSRVDRVMDANLVKTEAVALARAIQYLDELNTEELELTGTVYLPASKASQFRAGMRVEMKASHLTGMSDFVWVRLHEVTIVNIAEDPTLTYALAFTGVLGSASIFACSTALPAIEGTVETSADIELAPPYGPFDVPVGTDTFLSFSFIVVGANTHFVGDGNPMVQTEAGWVDTGQLPAPVSVAHTISSVSYRQNAGGDSTYDDGINIGCNDGRHMGFVVQGATYVQKATSVDGAGLITWATPLTPGNMVILCRVAEGPTGFGSDPHPNGTWTEVLSFLEPLENANSSMEIWGICVTGDNVDLLQTASAGSAWWVHAFEVSFA